jgi:hypothetical protein
VELLLGRGLAQAGRRVLDALVDQASPRRLAGRVRTPVAGLLEGEGREKMDEKVGLAVRAEGSAEDWDD